MKLRMISTFCRIIICLLIVASCAAGEGTRRQITFPQEDLVSSVQKGDLEGVKTAIKNGAWVNEKHQERLLLFGKPKYSKEGFSGSLGVGWTPLFWAAYEGHLDIAKYLIEQGATVNVQDDARATPVMFAVWGNKTDLVELLLKHGAETVERKYWMTLLMLAAASSNAETNCLNALLIDRMPIDEKDIDGWTALHHATRSPQKAAFLLQKGADPNIQDNLGMSALAYAVGNGSYETVKVLLDAGADPKRKTTEGKSTEDLAKEALESERLNAIKLKTMGQDTVLVTEGFIYQKDAGLRPIRLSVSGAKDGVLMAHGMTVITLDGGDLSYSLGAEWTFEKPDISFRNAGYIYTSKFNGATIDFREDGVLLKGFTWRHEKLERHQSVLELLQTRSK